MPDHLVHTQIPIELRCVVRFRVSGRNNDCFLTYFPICNVIFKDIVLDPAVSVTAEAQDRSRASLCKNCSR
jgi:hypothetical protein